jgi:mono/diheme cytochrome c family protein
MKLRCLCLLALFIALPTLAAELTIDLGHGAQIYSTAQLLARTDARDITIPSDVSFKRGMHYRVVPIRSLLDGVKPGEHLQFIAADGFTAEIDSTILLNTRGAQAWLAIEDPAHPWPTLAEKHDSAGPFYLVWTQADAGHISPEQWPYQLATIRRLRGVAARFPAIVPDPSVPAASQVRRGFIVFQRTCFACHTLNGEGDARLGPDLNIPHNPTQYLGTELLRAYIRDPQSLRRWPQAKMQGFDTRALSDADLDAVIAYLKYMVGHKTGH